MRTVFHEQLDALTSAIAELCDQTATMMQQATEALLHANLQTAEDVIDRRDDIDRECAALEATSQFWRARPPSPAICEPF